MNRDLTSRGLKSVCLLALLFLLPACSRPKTAAESSRENRSGPISVEALNLAPDLTTKPGNTFQATFTDKVVKMDQPRLLSPSEHQH
jgi:hypothetical protein